MTASEDETQSIVAHGTLLVHLVDGLFVRIEQHCLRMPVVARRLATQAINRAIASRRDNPAHGARRHSARRPALDRRQECVLNRLLGGVDVAEEPNEHGYRSAVLLAEDALDVRQRLVALKGRTSTGRVMIRVIRSAQPSAASRSGTSMMVMPPRYSLPSANGPSVMRTSSSLKRTTVALLGACRPPLNTQAPAAFISRRTASSWRMIGSSTSRGGIGPWG